MWNRAFGSRRSQPLPEGSKSLTLADFIRPYSLVDLGAVIVIGILAFIIGGYLGYSTEKGLLGGLLYGPFRPAGALFIWFSGVTLLIILRHPALKGRAMLPAVTFLVSIVLISLVYLDNEYNKGAVVNTILGWLQNLGIGLTGGRFLPNAINLFVLGGYTVSMLIRWVQRYWLHATSSAPVLNEASPSLSGVHSWRDLSKAMHGELFSGDLIAGAVLAGLLTLLLSVPVFTWLISLFTTGTGLSHYCAVSLPTSTCPGPLVTFISDLDVRILVLYAAFGGVFLASVSAIKAFQSGSPDQIVIEFFRSLFNALGRLLTLRIVFLIRDFVGPLLILAAAFGAAVAAAFSQCNLHEFGSERFTNEPMGAICSVGTGSGNPNVPLAAVGALVILVSAILALLVAPGRIGAISARVRRDVIALLIFSLALIEVLAFARTQALGMNQFDQRVLITVGGLLVAQLALILGISIYLVRFDMIGPSMTFLVLVSTIVVSVFWVFSLALASLDHFFVPSSWPHPFQPNDAAWFSLGWFVLSCITVLLFRKTLFRTRDQPNGEAQLSEPLVPTSVTNDDSTGDTKLGGKA